MEAIECLYVAYSHLATLQTDFHHLARLLLSLPRILSPRDRESGVRGKRGARACQGNLSAFPPFLLFVFLLCSNFISVCGMSSTASIDIPGAAAAAAAAVGLASPSLAGSSSSSFSPRKTRFFEYCALIPEVDENERKPIAASQGRPRLCARTYSWVGQLWRSKCMSSDFRDTTRLPVPSSSAVSDFAYKIVNGRDRAMRDDDPSFIPSPTSKLCLKLPSITRKRRNTTSSAPTVRGCLKNGRQSSTRPPMASRIRSSSFDPVYCPALASITSSPSSLPNGSTLPRPAESLDLDLANLPEDIMPLSPCCENCHDGVLYGQSPDSGYMEKWSESARRKREKDEESKYERGELKRKEGRAKLQDQVDELPPLHEVPECVDELELAKRRLARLDIRDRSDEASEPSVRSDESTRFDSPVESLSSRSSLEDPPCVRPCRNKSISSTINEDELAAALAEADKLVPSQPAKDPRPKLQSRESGSASGSGWGRLMSRSLGSAV